MGFVVPSVAQRDGFRAAAEALRDGDLAAAAQLSLGVDYQVVQMVDQGSNNDAFYALLPATWTLSDSTAVSGRGLFFVRSSQDTVKQLVLSAPHPRYDLYTGLVASNAFRQLRARSLAIAGTHRCANSLASGCSGTTTACGASSAPYRESDMAHMERGFFQVFHEAMDADLSSTIQHVQVHGFASGSDDPEFSISAGTTANVGDDNFASNLLATTLAQLTASAGSTKPGNSCNQEGDINRLCATSNTQGRYTNGVAPAMVCTTAAASANGRFVHAELSKAIRESVGSIGPQVFIDALNSTF